MYSTFLRMKTLLTIKVFYGDHMTIFFFSFKKDFIYLILEKGRENEGKKHQCVSCLSCAPNWGPDLQPKHVL